MHPIELAGAVFLVVACILIMAVAVGAFITQCLRRREKTKKRS